MVCDYGMSDKLGPLSYGQGDHEIFLGRDISQRRDFSEDTARVIDAEVHTIVMRNYQKAKSIIEEKRDKLIAIAESLLVRETLDGKEVTQLMDGETLPPKPPPADPSEPVSVPEPGKGTSLNPALNLA